MPGKHSPEKLELRRERARRRGYLQPRPLDQTKKFLQVPIDVAPRVKAISDSLAIQSEHNGITGKAIPIARASTRAARAFIDAGKYRSAMHIHDRANLAKHVWTEPAQPTSDVDGLPGVGAEKCLSPDAAVSDGIRAALSGFLTPPPCGAPPVRRVPTAEACTQTEHAMRAEAPAFYPASCDGLSLGRETSINNFDLLCQAQNSTIALLSGGIDKLLPSSRKIRDLERRLEQLRTSLTSTVQSRMKPEIDALRAETMSLVDMKCQCVMKVLHEMVTDSTESILRAVPGLVEAVVSASSENTLRAVPGIVEAVLRGREVDACELLHPVPSQPVQAADAQGPPPDVGSTDCSEPALPPVLVGDAVVLCNLEKAPSLHGSQGTVITDASNGRFGVRLYATGKGVSVLPHCLRLAPPLRGDATNVSVSVPAARCSNEPGLQDCTGDVGWPGSPSESELPD